MHHEPTSPVTAAWGVKRGEGMLAWFHGWRMRRRRKAIERVFQDHLDDGQHDVWGDALQTVNVWSCNDDSRAQAEHIAKEMGVTLRWYR